MDEPDVTNDESANKDTNDDSDDEGSVNRLMLHDCWIGMEQTLDYTQIFFVPGTISLAIGMMFYGLYKINYWPRLVDHQGYITFAVLLQVIVFLAFEFRGDVVFVCASFLLCMCGIITESDEWDGLSTPSILAIGSICAVVKGLENAHLFTIVLDPIIENVNAYSNKHMLQIYSLMAFASAFLNSNVVISMFKKIGSDYSQKCGISPKIIMAPISYLTMASARLTIIGTTTGLMVQVILKNDNKKPFPMFVPFIYAFASFIVICPVCILWSEYLFTSSEALIDGEDIESSAGRTSDSEKSYSTFDIDQVATHERHTNYICKFRVGRQKVEKIDIELCLKKWKVRFLKIKHDNKYVEMKNIKILNYEFSPDDIVYLGISIKHLYEIVLVLEWDIMEMDSDRIALNRSKDNVWAEAYIDPWSKLVGQKYGSLGDHTEIWTPIGIRISDKNYCLIADVDITLEAEVKSGHKMLLSGPRKQVTSHNVNFIGFHILTDEEMLDIHMFQIIVSGFCLLAIVIGPMVEGLSLLKVIIICLFFLIITEVETPTTMFQTFQWRVVLIAAGGIGLCKGITATKVGDLMADWILLAKNICDDDWLPVIYLWILMVALGSVVSPKCCIFIASPIIDSLDEQLETITEHQLYMVCLAAATFQCLSPFGTNRLVADAGYSFTDWTKLGLPLAVIDFVISFPFIMWVYPIIFPDLFSMEQYDGRLDSNLKFESHVMVPMGK